nr:phosphotransferase [Deinococcus planocerae]
MRAADECFALAVTETTRALLPDVTARLHAAFPEELALPRTHLHGDFRLCNVLHMGDEGTGLLDVDQATWGERLTDVCSGLVSALTHPGGRGVPDPRRPAAVLTDVRRRNALQGSS